MRSWFSMIGLVVVVAAVGLIASRQLSGLQAAPAASTAVAPVHGAAEPAVGGATQLPAQYKQALDAAMRTTRPIEGDVK